VAKRAQPNACASAVELAGHRHDSLHFTRDRIFRCSLFQKIEGAIAIGYRALFVLIRKVFEAFRFNSIPA
jgi:hypothetical protein